MALTLSQKILARTSGGPAPRPGDIVVARVDRAMSYDAYAGLLHRRFVERWGARARLWDADRLVLVADHFLDTNNPIHCRMQDELADFANAFGVQHYYPVGAANHGICHALLPEEGLVRPAELILGTDSHSCHYGGFGAIGLGVGVDAMEGVLAIGQYWIQLPPTVRITIDGRFPGGVHAKDVILRLCGDLANDKGLLGTAVELDGEAVQALHPEEKLTLANMGSELGARWLIIPPDDSVCQWVTSLGASDFDALHPDANAHYAREYRYRGEDFEPLVALPGAPDRVVAVKDLTLTRFNEVFVGSCTGAKRFDMEQFVSGLADNGPIAEGVRVHIVPATRKVHDWLLATPARRALLADPAIEVAEHAGCNACFGGHGFLAHENSVRFSTSNRNFPGRMGAREARVFLGSPALAARTAVTGTLGR
jgi:methanogen homoaconitase large subunit/3-benzylmalate isomerase